MNERAVERIVADARREPGAMLLEPEALELLAALGIESPPRLFVQRVEDVTDAELAGLAGDRVVVKVVSPALPHKLAAGGVRFVDKRAGSVRAAIESMAATLAASDVRGFSIHQFVPYSRALGSELLLTMRWTAEFGPVIACGFGGQHAELLARRLRPGSELAIASPLLSHERERRRALEESAAGELLRSAARSGDGVFPTGEIEQLWELAGRAALELPEDLLGELEINPIVFHGDRPLALDVLATLGTPERAAPERPLDKIRHLLQPRSIAIVGVSRRENPGRVILNNILGQGFDPDRLYVVRPGIESLQGCRVVPDLASLPAPVDLLIVALGARRAPQVVREAIERDTAESLIVISGGLGEKPGSEGLAAELRRALARSRASAGRGPVINGGNCLGIRSAPGRYDSLFIPPYKQRPPAAGDSRIALISQSGALLTAKMSRLDGVAFRYCVSVGNQLDLTLGDYLTYLQDDPELDLFAVYAEGFLLLDGLRFLRAARRIAARGGTVVLYRAGRTAAGARAAASHTAAMAGSYTVTRALARQAGIVTAETLGDFEDLIRLFGGLGPPAAELHRLAVVSNAGFECVAASDSLDGLELARFSNRTSARLASLLAAAGLREVVGVRNPLDLTPMLGDEAFAEAARIVLEDENVDAGVVGCVPLTPALNTLPPGAGHSEDVFQRDSVARRLIRLRERLAKPWVAVIDGGDCYRPLTSLLRENGVPTFETIDRAVRLMSRYARRGAGRSAPKLS